ncbi:MAG: hypothetical protein GY861_26075, partial [bacterium]|nr:hypothetical protein [bacterium]
PLESACFAFFISACIAAFFFHNADAEDDGEDTLEDVWMEKAEGSIILALLVKLLFFLTDRLLWSISIPVRIIWRILEPIRNFLPKPAISNNASTNEDVMEEEERKEALITVGNVAVNCYLIAALGVYLFDSPGVPFINFALMMWALGLVEGIALMLLAEMGLFIPSDGEKNIIVTKSRRIIRYYLMLLLILMFIPITLGVSVDAIGSFVIPSWQPVLVDKASDPILLIGCCSLLFTIILLMVARMHWKKNWRNYDELEH